MTSVLDPTALPLEPAPDVSRGWRRVLRGRPADPAWVRPGLVALLAATAVLYLWDLGASGWANAFYSAAVQAGTKSWKALLFGSFDASNAITVDKPPASLWVMELSARVFGVNAWSILVPQALEGMAAVGLLFATVRRRFGPAAGLLAGAVLATTPVAVLMFRFNNPDALLVLLLVAAAYAVMRALGGARVRWLALAGVLVGFAFITKMMQAFLVVPGFALVYLLAAPTSVWRRVRHLVVAGVAMLAAGGWWVAVVELTPASARPYIGGSTDNDLLNLVFGYNGFGRLTGNETGSVVGGGGQGQAGAWGATGWSRLFGAEMGGQVSWLLPSALVLLVAMLWLSRRARRTDLARAEVVLWGSWLVVTGLTFSYAAGIIHPYYTVALAPAIAALVGAGGVTFWRARGRSRAARLWLAVSVAAAAAWSWVLLDRSASWLPWLRVAVVVAGAVAVIGLVGGAAVGVRGRMVGVVAAGALVAGLGGPAAYAVDTARTAHSGSIPSAGPAVAAQFGGPGGRGFAGGRGFPGGAQFGTRPQFGTPPQFGTRPQFGGTTTPPNGFGGGFAGRGGGLLDASSPSAALVAALKADASRYAWVAATVGANSAAGYQLATDLPVMAIGGFNGTDPSPTLAQFQADVVAGQVHYFIASGRGGGFGPGGGSGSSTSSQITSWVEQHFTAATIGGTTVYDLTSAQR